MPDSDQLKRIRKAIDQHPDEFLSIINHRSFKKRFGALDGNRLQRIPKGYEESHPMAHWLKLKQFFVGVAMPESACRKASLVEAVASVCEDAAPLVRFLNRSLSK